MNSEVKGTLTLDDETFNVGDLSNKAKELTIVLSEIQRDAAAHRRKLIQLSAAERGISDDLKDEIENTRDYD